MISEIETALLAAFVMIVAVVGWAAVFYLYSL